MPDDRNEALAIWKQYYGDADGLALHLTRICLSKLGVVYEVFNLLNDYYDFNVGCLFRKKIDGATLQKLLETNEGIAFCKKLYAMLNEGWYGVPIQQGCYTTPNELILFKWLIDSAKVKPNDTGQPRKLSDAEIEYYTTRGQNQPLVRNTKRGLIAVAESKRRLFKREVVWELPNGGTGFVTYNRNDIKKPHHAAIKIDDAQGLDQIGTKETIERIMHIAREWYVLYADRPLEVGDVSRPGGINTTEHSTHVGNEFDIRPQSKSKTVGGLTWASSDYSFALTKEFILLVLKLYPGTEFLFNDKELHQTDPETRNFVSPEAAHDDHLHVILPAR